MDHSRRRRRLSAVLIFVALLAVVLAGLVPLAQPLRVAAQIDNNQPGQPFASVVDCIRTGPDISSTTPTSASPRFATTCFGSAWRADRYGGVNAEPQNGDALPSDPAVVSFGDGQPNTPGSEPGHISQAQLSQVGAAYGVAYQSGSNAAAPAVGQQRRLFVGAYTKRLTRFAAGGPGAIYQVNYGTGATSLYVQVPDVVPGPNGVAGDPGDGSAASFPDGRTAANYNPYLGGVHGFFEDALSTRYVSVTGLGDIDLDSSERYLYATNLRTRNVYRYDTWSSNPQSTQTVLPTLPSFGSASTCNASGASGPFDLHPFGMDITTDSLYLGFVCAAQASANNQDLAAGVWRYDLASNTWVGVVAAFALPNYAAQRGIDPGGKPMAWRPWTNAIPPFGGGYFVPHPEPVLADITFNESAQMVIGLRDRIGDMGGYRLPNAYEQAQGYGDLLLAPLTGSYQWGAPTTGPETYNDDSSIHSERAMGALAYVPGTRGSAFGGEVVSSMTTPYRIESAGFAWYDVSGGNPTTQEEIYYSSNGGNPNTLSKSSGLGDVELLCVWRAIGDRVWRDSNGNGVQDPGEPDITGVTLILRNSGGSELARVTTGAVAGMPGNWRFYVSPFQSYTVEIDPAEFQAGGTLNGLGITSANVGGNDATDSDADSNGRVVIASAGRGDLNTTYDVGLSVGTNVRITKTGPATALGSQTIAYTLVATNDGPSSADNFTVSDTLPAGMTFVSASPARSSASGQTSTWNFGTVAAGTNRTITVNARVDITAGSLVNTAQVTTTTPGDPPGDNSSTVTTVVNSPNVTIQKTGPATVTAGSNLSYQLTYRNTGSVAAANVTVRDVIPVGVTFVSASPAPSGSYLRTYGWNLGTLAPGAQGTITVNVQTDSTLANGTSLVNQSDISTTTPGDPTGDNFSNVTTTVIVPNVTIQKTGPATVTAGDSLSYQLTYRNTGTAAAAGTVVQDTLPAGVIYQSASPAPSSVSGQTLTWNLGTLASGAQGTITVNTTASSSLANGTALVNQTQISTTTPGDPPGDNSSSVTTIVQRADVRITKSSPNTFPVTSGSPVTYYLDFSNAGPAAAANVQITDVVPAQISGVTWQCTAGCSGSGSGNSITVNLGTLAAGATGRITVQGTATTSVARADFINTAQITTSTPETDTTNNQSSVPGAVWTTEPQIIKLAQSQVVAGNTFSATLTYKNNGPAPATGVVVQDTLPAGVTFVSANPAPTSVSGQTLTWNLGTLADGQTGTISLVLQAAATIPHNTTVTNQSQISTTGPDRDTSNNTSSAQTVVIARADLQIVKDGPARVSAGDLITYTLTYRNAGPSLARSAVVTDTLPAAVDYLTSSPAASSIATPTLTWNLGDLPPGATGTLLVTVRTRTGQTVPTLTVLNSAQIDSPTDDPTPENNRDDHPVDVETPDVSILKTMPATVTAGVPFTATLDYANAGPAAAVDVVVRDVLPAGLTLVSSQPPANPDLSWSLGDLAAGATGQITLTLQAPSTTAAGTVLTNTAQITTTSDDRDLTNNESQVPTTVETSADLAILKTGPAGPLRSGSVVTYTLAWENRGPSQAQDATVTDTLPPGFTLLATAPQATTSTSTTLTWALGTIDTGATGTITVTGTLVGAADQVRTNRVNTATIASPTPDPTPSNNTSSVTTVVIRPDLAIHKTDGRTTVQPGETLTYTLTVTNSGLITATDVLLTETPPAGVLVVAGPWRDQSDGTWTLGAGDLAPGATLTRTFVVRLPNPLPAALLTEIRNIGTVDDADPGDPTPDDTTSTDVDQPIFGRIGDRVWVDTNGDGVQDPNEPGMPFMELELIDPRTGAVLATVLTDASGMYEFTGLAWGDYVVRIAQTTLSSVPINLYVITTDPQPQTTLTPQTPVDLRLDIGLKPPVTTAVLMSYLLVEPDPTGGTVVRWGTLDEQDTDHFRVVRGRTPATSSADALGTVASVGSRGGDYRFRDATPPAGAAYYWVVEVETDGTETWYGPALTRATPTSTNPLYLPLLAR